MQQVKDAFPVLALHQNLPYLDAAVGMHPDVNPYDRGHAPQVFILAGDDVVAFLQQEYGVNPIHVPRQFLTPAIIAETAQFDAGMADFNRDLIVFMRNHQNGNFQVGLGPIKDKIFAYCQRQQLTGKDIHFKPMINIQV